MGRDKFNTILCGIRSRCSNGYKHLGTKCLLTKSDVEALWNRDGASSLSKPSIDRIDTYGDYSYNNCRFIELRDNKARLRSKSPLSKNRFKGVYWQKSHKRFRVTVSVDNRLRHIGYFSTEEEAHRVYESMVTEVFNMTGEQRR